MYMYVIYFLLCNTLDAVKYLKEALKEYLKEYKNRISLTNGFIELLYNYRYVSL